ncbi:HemK2/MTQ2 family protein methyltransferase [Kitasatospora sp. MBT63]|uniref:HemK2/MTQ2 family protein methyltransferase n=1 Tax=Kitasatospora sp. MBT63 TaxID=1444768 RepID=UPI00053B0973|nr:HemK2/MTQ2 family protein methyltransferase [Kitasatospora sp. MBT63]
MRLMRPPGVYRAQEDTELLISRLVQESLGPGDEVLDVGTGTGAVALAAAGTGARVTAVDVSWRALAAAWLNGVLNRRAIRVRHGDLLTPVRGRKFALVVSNPPYVPAAAVDPPTHGPGRAWDAGPDGRAVLDRICREVPGLLARGGVLLLVQSSLCGVEATCVALERAGLDVQVTARRCQPFGPVMSARAGWFEERGLIAAGEREEELVVVRGVRPR